MTNRTHSPSQDQRGTARLSNSSASKEVERERDAALREATSLAVWLHRNFYSEVTQWRPLEYPAGVISQIDNMVAGVAEKLRKAEAERDALARSLTEANRACEAIASERDALKARVAEVLGDIAEFNNGDDTTLGAIHRLAQIRARASELHATLSGERK